MSEEINTIGACSTCQWWNRDAKVYRDALPSDMIGQHPLEHGESAIIMDPSIKPCQLLPQSFNKSSTDWCGQWRNDKIQRDAVDKIECDKRRMR